MNFLQKILVISVICINTWLTLACAQTPPAAPSPAPTPVPPSADYVPATTEFTSHYSTIITEIGAAVTAKDKEKLKAIATELSAREESNNTRADDDEKYFLLGFTKRIAGDLEGAVSDFNKSIEYRQSNPYAHFLLAQTYADQGKCENVFGELDQVRFLLGTEPAAGYLLRGQCLSKLNRQPEADTLVTAARKAYPADVQIKKLSLSFKAKALSQGLILDDAQTAELEGDLADLAVANPEDSNIQLMYAKSLLKKGDILTKPTELDNAETIARTQVDKFKYKNETAVKLLFDILLKKRKNSDAQDVLNKAKEQMPDSKVLEDCQKQLEIEVQGLKVLKFDRR